jgi:hypothetical protein
MALLSTFPHHGKARPGFLPWIYAVDKGISVIVLMNRQDLAGIEHLAWDFLSLFEPSLKYSYEQVKGDLEEKYARMVLRIIDAIRMDAPHPEGLTKQLRVFMNSENGRGLWKWYFERGFPDTAYCVDSEMIGNSKAYRFILPFQNKTEYRITVLINPENELVQFRWW